MGEWCMEKRCGEGPEGLVVGGGVGGGKARQNCRLIQFLLLL